MTAAAETIPTYELALFDNESYRKPSKIGVKINGTIWLDPAIVQDAQLIAQLVPGRPVSWQIEGLCVGGGARVSVDNEGNVDGSQFVGAVNVLAVFNTD